MIDIGDEATLSEGQKSLCRRAATLEVNLEQLEAKMSEGQSGDLDVFNRLSGNLRRIFETLGLDRKARDINHGPLHEHFNTRRARVTSSKLGEFPRHQAEAEDQRYQTDPTLAERNQ
jgi:hypothetical protein